MAHYITLDYSDMEKNMGLAALDTLQFRVLQLIKTLADSWIKHEDVVIVMGKDTTDYMDLKVWEAGAFEEQVENGYRWLKEILYT